MRESGILMHLSSLPGPYGIGSMGKSAYHFVDFLEKSGQAFWQILPLAPTGYGNSPYQSASSCAGNPYLIDLDTLVQEGLLTKAEIDSFPWGEDPLRVDFGALYESRFQVLKIACGRFVPGEDYWKFLEENQDWLPDYSLFMAIKNHFGGKPWLDWPQELRFRDPEALEKMRRTLEEEIRLQCFMQYEFMKQWQALRAYAAEKKVRIIGDVPIYVPMDSAEVWTEPELFQLDEDLYPVVVAGCPPDAFTADGQLWGNPIYRWQQHAATGYEWWIHRLRAAGKLYDVIRIDHFRAFESYWAVPYGDKTARGGAWVKGPGMDFLRAIRNALPDLDFIAEDLGFITPEVRQLQVDSGYPGMKVIEFAFDSREESDYLPHRYPVDSVCYTGTHDNVTVKQWFDEAAEEDVAFAKAYLGLNSEEGWVWGMIRGGMGSVSRLFVAQMQDYLELGKAGRMNFPGTLTNDNWTWRAEEGFDADALADRIYTMTCMYGRCPRRPEPEAEETEETEA